MGRTKKIKNFNKNRITKKGKKNFNKNVMIKSKRITKRCCKKRSSCTHEMFKKKGFKKRCINEIKKKYNLGHNISSKKANNIIKIITKKIPSIDNITKPKLFHDINNIPNTSAIYIAYFGKNKLGEKIFKFGCSDYLFKRQNELKNEFGNQCTIINFWTVHDCRLYEKYIRNFIKTKNLKFIFSDKHGKIKHEFFTTQNFKYEYVLNFIQKIVDSNMLYQQQQK